jgi:hypothetical protein
MIIMVLSCNMTGDIPLDGSAPNTENENSTSADAGVQQEDGGFFSNIRNGLGRLTRNGFSPWLLIGGMAMMSMTGAPMWATVAMGLVGFMMISGGRNGMFDTAEENPNAQDIPIGNGRDPQELARGRQRDAGDIAINDIASSQAPASPATSPSNIPLPTLSLGNTVQHDPSSSTTTPSATPNCANNNARPSLRLS